MEINRAKIYFADGYKLTLNNGDLIHLIKQGFKLSSIKLEKSDKNFILSLLQILNQCDYFYLDNDTKTIYKESSIVKIKYIDKPNFEIMSDL